MAIPIGWGWSSPLDILIAILNGKKAYEFWVKEEQRRVRLKELELLVKEPA